MENTITASETITAPLEETPLEALPVKEEEPKEEAKPAEPTNA